ncbi:hypothetical protein PC129_g23843 [Phytophthora cactorum]|uniref:Uncharacterized protein n=1 Tax=Phytophthora cactorum TaxID=29920 RepID=A0A8T1AC91_9STRA|nr:hypothetical protein Pcac1_g4143 [Phytophthora cactorum]KAG2791315.1 hypothetical protein PC111_g23983 [Phytophthora cactorum]KAG2791720.1 hypothetical protein PC112_g24141 [Phytophthora cactorum]KAG2808216.1 hypothetical protein PC113_g23972 [Phytophthora cactorum]KAG2871378.1 hypothetical protein PC114_g26951 [Phytophthora cactorum]
MRFSSLSELNLHALFSGISTEESGGVEGDGFDYMRHACELGLGAKQQIHDE